MKTLLSLLLFLCLGTPVISQTLFQKTIGGAGNESARTMIKTADGGFALLGGTTTYGQDSGDVYLVKMYNSGSIQWTKTYGTGTYDGAAGICQTSDGGFIMAGRTGYWEFGIYIIKVDSLGNLQWDKKMNIGLFDQAYSVIQTVDGGYVITGRTFNQLNYDGILIKLRNNGTTQWIKNISGFNDGAYTLVQSNDLSLVIAGFSAGANADLCFMKIDSLGNFIWGKKVGGAGMEMSISSSKIIQTNDNGYAYAGTTNSYGAGLNDMYVVKISSTGSLQFAKAIGTTLDEYGYGLTQLANKSYIITGTRFNVNATTDSYLACIDSTGNLLWTDVLGGSGNEDGNAVLQLNNGDIFAAGSTDSYGNGGNIYLTKLLSTGITCGNYSSAGSAISGGTLTSIAGGTSTTTLNIQSGNSMTSSGGTLNSICNCTVPVAVITAQTTSICSGSSTIILTNATPGNTYSWYLNANLISGANSPTYTATQTGTYVCVQTNSCGTSSSNPINITIHPLPSAAITAGGPTTFCSGGNVSLSAVSNINYSYQWLRNGGNITGATSVNYSANTSGNYKVQVTNNSTGCVKSGAAIKVTVQSLPIAAITALGPTTFCAGSSVTLQANSGSGLTYKWKKNAVTIPGATNSSYVATLAGNYKALVTNSNGCTKLSNTISIVVPCRNGNKFEEMTVKVSPNPTSSIFKFEINGNQQDFIHLTIFDLTGRMVLSADQTENNFTIDASRLPAGIYTAVIEIDGVVKTLKLIKIAE